MYGTHRRRKTYTLCRVVATPSPHCSRRAPLPPPQKYAYTAVSQRETHLNARTFSARAGVHRAAALAAREGKQPPIHAAIVGRDDTTISTNDTCGVSIGIGRADVDAGRHRAVCDGGRACGRGREVFRAAQTLRNGRDRVRRDVPRRVGDADGGLAGRRRVVGDGLHGVVVVLGLARVATGLDVVNIARLLADESRAGGNSIVDALAGGSEHRAVVAEMFLGERVVVPACDPV